MSAREPSISVVVPTHGRPHYLARCLEALARLTFPREGFEVIVVDDGGDGSNDAVVRPFEDRLDVNLVRQPRAGPGAARNMGADRARGKLLAFTDDDCAPEPRWLGALAAASARAPGHAIGGMTLNGARGNRYSAASQAVVDAFHATATATARSPASSPRTTWRSRPRSSAPPGGSTRRSPTPRIASCATAGSTSAIG